MNYISDERQLLSESPGTPKKTIFQKIETKKLFDNVEDDAIPNEDTSPKSLPETHKIPPSQSDKAKETGNNGQDEEDKKDNSISVSIENLKNCYERKKNLKAEEVFHLKNVFIVPDDSLPPFGLLRITPNNKYLIAVSRYGENSIKVFEIQTGRQVHYLQNIHSALISSAIVTSNNKYLISGQFFRPFKKFDLETGEEVHLQENPNSLRTDSIQPEVVGPDCRLTTLVTNEEIIVLNLETGQAVQYIEIAHQGDNGIETGTAIVTPGNKHIIFGSPDGSIELYNLETGEEIYRLPNVHQKKMDKLIVTSDNKILISAVFHEKSIKVIDLDKRKEVYHFENSHQDSIHSMIMTSNNNYIISASDDKSIKVFDIHAREEVHHFQNVHEDLITSVTITSDDRFIISGSEDGSIKVFDLNTKEEVHHLKSVHQKSIISVIVTSDNSYMISASKDGSLKIFNLDTNCLREKISHSDFYSFWRRPMIITSDNRAIFVSQEIFIKILDLHSGKARRSLNTFPNRITSMTVTSDNKFLVYCADRSIKIFNLKDEKEEKEEKDLKNVHKRDIYSVTVTPDSKIMVSGSYDETVAVFKFETKRKLYYIQNASNSPISLMTMTSDNKFLMTGSDDGSIQVFDLEIKDEVRYFERAHQYAIEFLIIYDKRLLFSTGRRDRSIKIFDLLTKQQIHEFKNIHRNPISSTILTSDNKFLISAGERERLIKVFDLDTKQQVHSFDNSDQDFIYSMAMISDKRFIVNGTAIKIFDFYAKKEEKFDFKTALISDPTKDPSIFIQNCTILNQPFSFIYEGMKQFSVFNSADAFLFNKPVEESVLRAKRQPGFFVLPFRWTILHIVSIYANHSFIEKMPGYSQFKMPFLLDALNNTPFHYLIAQNNKNLITANIMFCYLCDYLEDCYLKSSFEFQRIIKSLCPLLPFILEKIAMKTKSRFFNIIYAKSPVPHNIPAPPFGNNLTEPAFSCDSPVLTNETREKIWNDKGAVQIKFCSNFLYLDYNVLSQDMNSIIECLKNQEDEDFFKIASIRELIDHLWGQAKTPGYITYSVYFAFIVALSVYLTFEDRSFAYEMTLLMLSVLFIANEVFQFSHLEEIYLNDLWSWIDFIHLLLTIVFLMTRFADDDNELARAWMSSIIIILGCLRCISLLRIFKPTRNLIQAIITSTLDVRSFVVIIVFIIIHTSLIFLVFNRENGYGDCLYQAYNVLYGPVDIEEYAPWTFSQKLIMVVLAFFLSVVLLNLLIAIMYKSHDDVLDMRNKTDSLTRLKIISKAVIYKKLFQPKHQTRRGYLVYCLPEEFEEDEYDNNKELEKNINALKKITQTVSDQVSSFEGRSKTMKSNSTTNDEAIKDEISALKNEITTVKDEISTMKEEVLNVKSKATNAKANISIIKNEISHIKTDISTMKNEMSNLREIILSGFSSLKRGENLQVGRFPERQGDISPGKVLNRNLLEDSPELEDSNVSQPENISS